MMLKYSLNEILFTRRTLKCRTRHATCKNVKMPTSEDICEHDIKISGSLKLSMSDLEGVLCVYCVKLVSMSTVRIKLTTCHNTYNDDEINLSGRWTDNIFYRVSNYISRPFDCYNDNLTHPPSRPFTLCHCLAHAHARFQEFFPGGPRPDCQKTALTMFHYIFSPQLILQFLR